MVGTGPFTPAVDGTEVGFDFNPSVDRIRIVTNNKQNLRVHPDTGVLAGMDTPLAYAATDANRAAMPVITGSAYTNNVPGGTPTTLYGIDSMGNALVTQGSVNAMPVTPNTGMLFTVGALNVNTSLTVGFDISATGDAFMALNPEGTTRSTLYAVDLATGSARSGQLIGVTELVRDIAIELPIPPPAAPDAGAPAADAGADAAPAADAGVVPGAGNADAGAGAGMDAGAAADAGADTDASLMACSPDGGTSGSYAGTFSCSSSPTGGSPASTLGFLAFAAAFLGGLRRRVSKAKSKSNDMA